MAAGRAGRYTIQWSEGGVLKIELPANDVITAFTGAAGLGQRFNEQLTDTIRTLPRTFQARPDGPRPSSDWHPDSEDSSQQSPGRGDTLRYDRRGRDRPYRRSNHHRGFPTYPIDTPECQRVGTSVTLFALPVKDDTPQLIDFDPVQFHPELKGLPDPDRAEDRIWRCVSMGAGQQLADAFLAHAHHVLFGDKIPTVDRAKARACSGPSIM